MTRLTDVERAERRMIQAEMQALIVGDNKTPGIAMLLGWDWLHVRPGLKANGRWWTATTGTLAKWPDLVLVHAGRRRLIFAELVGELDQPTPEQTAVLDLLRALEFDRDDYADRVMAMAFKQPVGDRDRDPIWATWRDALPSIDVAVWGPSDLRDPIETSRIYEVLR